MKPSIATKLASLDARLKEIDARLADPDAASNMDSFRKISQERAEISPVVEAYGEYRKAEEDLAAGEEMARGATMIPPASLRMSRRIFTVLSSGPRFIEEW